MERLTMKGASGLWCSEGSVGRDDEGRVYTEALDRLAAYEDTGLTPEELDELFRELSNIRIAVGVATIKELLSIAQDGRLVALPHKRDMAINHVASTPSADVAPVRHGRWILNTDNFSPGMRCSLCAINFPVICGDCVKKELDNYCPNCGAKMDGKAESQEK